MCTSIWPPAASSRFRRRRESASPPRRGRMPHCRAPNGSAAVSKCAAEWTAAVRLLFRAVEHREPDGRGCGIGPFDAGAQQALFGLVGKAQAGGARKQYDPFALVLVVPEAGRALLSQRDDARDP